MRNKNARIGRPPKSPTERLSQGVNFYMNPDLSERLKSAADKNGQTLSEFIRETLQTALEQERENRRISLVDLQRR